MFIRITEQQANSLRKKYGDYHALDPIPLPDTADYILTDAVLSEPAFASALATLEALPTYAQWSGSGVNYALNQVVEFDGRLKRCISPHASQSDWSPAVAVSLWVTAHRDGEIPVWIAPTGAHDAWPLGAKVRHADKYWESLIAANVWQPGAVGSESLWREITAAGEPVVVEPTTGAWAAGVAYAVNDEVTYNGATYRCRQAHTAQVGWEPPNVLALWLPL